MNNVDSVHKNLIGTECPQPHWHLISWMMSTAWVASDVALRYLGFLCCCSVQSSHIFHYQLPHSGYNTLALDTFVALQNCFQEKEECKVKCSTRTALHNFLFSIKYLVIIDFVCFVFLSRKWWIMMIVINISINEGRRIVVMIVHLRAGATFLSTFLALSNLCTQSEILVAGCCL